MALWSGRQPAKRTQEMLCYFLMGWASAEEVAAHIAKLKASDDQAAKKSDGGDRSTASGDPSRLTLRDP